jgi:hypothetical protein
MSIAYLILAHDTPNHLRRLVRALDSRNAAFFIHVDHKADISRFRDTLSQANVRFLENRVAIHWGEFSIVQATINLMLEALNYAPHVHYLCLLSGSDYPLRSPQYIEAFLSQNQGREFINLVPMPCEAVNKPLERLQEYRLQTPNDSQFIRRAVACLNYLINNRLRLRRDHLKALEGLVPYAGSQWWTLTVAASRYILSFIDSKPDVLRFFRNVSIPDESFFQTVIGNSEFAKRVARNLTFTDWSRPASNPALIDMHHLYTLLNTGLIVGDNAYGRGELLFARKFPEDSSLLTDFIDAHFRGKSA